MVSSYPLKISLITCCKGRLEFLRQTLPSMATQFLIPSCDYEVIVVDYGDPDCCFEYVYRFAQEQNTSNVWSLRVLDNTKFWRPGRARNIGAVHASGELLFFIDADIKIGSRLVSEICKSYQQEHWEVWRRNIFLADGGSMNGTCVVTRESFFELRGYNEIGVGWVLEDVDLYNRYDVFKKRVAVYNPRCVDMVHLAHKNTLRVINTPFSSHIEAQRTYYNQYRKMYHHMNPKGFGLGKVKILRFGGT